MNENLKEIGTLVIKAGLATAPFCGGIAEVFGWAVEGRFVEKRLSQIESLLGDKQDKFFDELKLLDEHEYFVLRKLLKFHCFEAMPELTPVTAKAIIHYALENSRSEDDQIIEILCRLNASDFKAILRIKDVVEKQYEGDCSKTLEWEKLCPLRSESADGQKVPMRLSDMLNIVAVDEDNNVKQETTVEFNTLAISFSKLHQLRIISAFHSIYPGMNTDLDIDQFTITSFGKRILEYIDSEDKTK